MKKFFMPVVSILLVMLIVCSMSLPAFATHKPLVASDEADTEDDFDSDYFAGYTEDLGDSYYEDIPISTVPIETITQPLQYSEDILAAYESFYLHLEENELTYDISIEDFYESYCRGNYQSAEDYLNDCIDEISNITLASQTSLGTEKDHSSERSAISNTENARWYYNTGLTPTQKPVYSRYNLLNIVQKGDIIHESGNHHLHHAALVEGIYYSAEYSQYYIRLLEVIGYSSGEGQADGVCRSILDDDRFDHREATVLRLKDEYKTDAVINSAIAFFISQIGKPYDIDFIGHSPSADELDWYCSQLVWAAFYNQGVNLEDFYGTAVLPDELLSSPKLNTIASYTNMVEVGVPSITSIYAPTATSAKLNWSKVSGATSYQIYRAPNAGGTYSLIASVSRLYYTDNTLETNSAYCYKVAATLPTATTNTSEIRAVRTAFKAPVFMSIHAASSTSVFLHWSSVYNAEYYRIYRATSEAGPYQVLTTTSMITHTDTSCVQGTLYYYKIEAVSSNNSSVYSVIKNIKPLRVITPTFYFIEYISSNNCVKLNWTFSLNATHYIILRSTALNPEYTPIGTSEITEFFDYTLPNNSTYFRYKVIATDGTYESDQSEERGVGISS